MINKVDCTGCCACADVCPKQAIIIKSDTEGFLIPEIDENKCIQCNACDRVCPLKKNGNNDYKKFEYYSMVNRNIENLMASASEGAFSLLAEYALGEHGYVWGGFV